MPKDSGGAKETLEAYLQVAKEVDGFEVYSCPDHLVLCALQNGAADRISGPGNAIPQVLAGILKAFNTGEIDEAEKQQAIFAAFRTDLYALGFAPAMVKRALFLQDPPPVRAASLPCFRTQSRTARSWQSSGNTNVQGDVPPRPDR